jgi:hypothetical protein
MKKGIRPEKKALDLTGFIIHAAKIINVTVGLLDLFVVHVTLSRLPSVFMFRLTVTPVCPSPALLVARRVLKGTLVELAGS